MALQTALDTILYKNFYNLPLLVQRAELKAEDYKSFYRELYPMQFEEPLFNIHLNVDYPFNLTGKIKWIVYI